MKVEEIRINEIKIDKYNPRVDLTRKDKEYRSIVNSIKRFGLVEPLVVNSDMTLIGGHQRLKIMREVFNAETIPCVVVDLDKRQEKALNIALNKITGRWDYDILREVINEIKDDALDIGFTEKEISNLFDEEKNDTFNDDDDTIYSSRVITLKEDVIFPSSNKMGFPEILPDMALICETPELYEPDKKQEKIVFYNFGSDSTKNLRWDKCVIGFYVDDSRFERVWNDTRKYVAQFINNKIVGCVSPNFSAYYDYPAAIRIYNIFRSRWIARYMQEAGIRVVLDMSGSPEDVEWAFLGIPKGFPVCFQIHREKIEHSEKKNEFIAAALAAIDPQQVWCYGQEEKSEWYPALKSCGVKYITPRTVSMRRRING